MCCAWLTGNAGPKKSPKICHLGTIAQLCLAIYLQLRHVSSTIGKTSGYATMVHGRGCNPHRSKIFTNLEITSLWRHWWRHNSESIRDREKRRPPRPMKSSELSNGETASLYDNFCKAGNEVIDDVVIWVQDGNCKKWLETILVLVRSTI